MIEPVFRFSEQVQNLVLEVLLANLLVPQSVRATVGNIFFPLLSSFALFLHYMTLKLLKILLNELMS